MESKIEVRTVRALKDNYCYLLTRRGSTLAVVIDPSEAAPIAEALRANGLKLGLILNTHHHHDHIGGNRELASEWKCPVFCSLRDVDRVPEATQGLRDGEHFEFNELSFQVISIPGHTEGQIAFHTSDHLFVGDTVFEMGCGRLFEGTAAQMFESFQRIEAFPASTRLHFGHEYSEVNARFALSVDPNNAAAISSRLATVRDELSKNGSALAPTLADEKVVNPFFRVRNVADFARLREARNGFE